MAQPNAAKALNPESTTRFESTRPNTRGRSPVPDLLFEDARLARLAEIAPLLADPELHDSAVPLHRITVFLTYRCNLVSAARTTAGEGWRPGADCGA